MEALLDSRAISLVISLEFARKQRFKLKKFKRLIYVRNVDSTFNKELIKHIVKINIFYKGFKERTEINMIKRHKQNIILGMLQLAHHNPEIDWKIGEVKITRYSEEYRKQQRENQSGKNKRKEKKEKKKKEDGKRKSERRKKKPKGEKTIKVK